MRGKLALLLILIILFGGFVFVRFFILDQQNVFGRIKVVSSPTATVFLNNVAVGKTPYEDKLKVNEYLLKLIPEGTATEAASWNGKVKIFKNALTYVNRELGTSEITSAGEIFMTSKMDSPAKSGYGEIYVETDPIGTIVSLDNDEKGVAPLVLQDVVKGEHEVSVYLPGFFRRTQKINVDEGYRVSAIFKLAIDQSYKQLSPTPGAKEATGSAKTKLLVTIKDTPQGWLRVRVDASTDASEEAKVKPGQKYEFLDEKTGWYEIKFNGDVTGLVSGTFDTGWISSQYSSKE